MIAQVIDHQPLIHPSPSLLSGVGEEEGGTEHVVGALGNQPTFGLPRGFPKVISLT